MTSSPYIVELLMELGEYQLFVKGVHDMWHSFNNDIVLLENMFHTDTLLIATQLDLHLFYSSTSFLFFTGFVLVILLILIMYVSGWIALLVNVLCNGLVVFTIRDPHNVCASLPLLAVSLYMRMLVYCCNVHPSWALCEENKNVNKKNISLLVAENE